MMTIDRPMTMRGGTVSENGAVPSALKAIETSISSLDSAVTTLLAKLGPVIRPHPSATSPDDPKPGTTDKCAVAYMIETQTERLERLQGMVVEVINYLEL